MVVHFKSVRMDVLLVQKYKKPYIIPSERINFGLIYNSSKSEIFACPHGSSLCRALQNDGLVGVGSSSEK